MIAEKGAPGTIVTFASIAAASLRIAGVAAAARAARDLADAGRGPVWLALPGGGPLPAAVTDDLVRLLGPDDGRVVALEDLPALGLGPDVVVPAPPMTSRVVLRATGKPSDGPVSRWLNRPISRAISAVLLAAVPSIRPLHATIGTALIAAAMLAALLFGGASGLVAGGLLFHAASAFDGVDGEIARATFRTSRAGAILDRRVDIATNLGFILGVTVNLGVAGSPYAIVLGGWGLALFVLGLLILGLGASRGGGPLGFDMLKQLHRGRMSQPAAHFVRAATIVSSRDFFALLFALLILAGWPILVLGIFAAAATVWIMVVAAVAWSRAAGTERSA